MLDYIRYTDIQTIDLWLTVVTYRFLFLVGGPSCSLTGGGWVSANKTSSGMKSLCSEVGRGFLLSRALPLFLSSGKAINTNV